MMIRLDIRDESGFPVGAVITAVHPYLHMRLDWLVADARQTLIDQGWSAEMWILNQ